MSAPDLPRPGGFSHGALSVVEGQEEAAQMLLLLREGMAPADLLHEALERDLRAGDALRLRGWCRALQKALERAA